jgi:hypothetical protein
METQTIELIEPDMAMDQRPANLPAVQPPSALSAVDQILAKAAASGATLEQMERFMALAERMRDQQISEEKRQAEKAFRADFARFKSLNVVVPKTKQVTQRAKSGGQGPTFKQSEFNVVADLLQPALSSCGFGYRFDVKFERGVEGGAPWCSVTCKLEHRAGHVEVLTMGGPPDDSGSKNPLQEMQSSATFLMRHSLLAITGTAQAGSDNDGRGARGYRDDDGEVDGGGQASELDALRDAGRAEAMKGMKPLTEWWGKLDAKRRNMMNAEFGALRRCAATADEKGATK